MPQFDDAEDVLRYARSDLFQERCLRKSAKYDEFCFMAVTTRESAVDQAVRLCEEGIGPDRLLMMLSMEEELTI